MIYTQLVSYKNLELAWRRINTATNHAHKRYFRPIYYSYETALEKNLKDLSTRLSGGSFNATKPIRIYTPKNSGLQRPITLLCVEDQIVYQAIANPTTLSFPSTLATQGMGSPFTEHNPSGLPTSLDEFSIGWQGISIVGDSKDASFHMKNNNNSSLL